jgi:hypothetical protein
MYTHPRAYLFLSPSFFACRLRQALLEEQARAARLEAQTREQLSTLATMDEQLIVYAGQIDSLVNRLNVEP